MFLNIRLIPTIEYSQNNENHFQIEFEGLPTKEIGPT